MAGVGAAAWGGTSVGTQGWSGRWARRKRGGGVQRGGEGRGLGEEALPGSPPSECLTNSYTDWHFLQAPPF